MIYLEVRRINPLVGIDSYGGGTREILKEIKYGAYFAG